MERYPVMALACLHTGPIYQILTRGWRAQDPEKPHLVQVSPLVFQPLELFLSANLRVLAHIYLILPFIHPFNLLFRETQEIFNLNLRHQTQVQFLQIKCWATGSPVMAGPCLGAMITGYDIGQPLTSR